MTTHKYRGFTFVRNTCYKRGEWGSWVILDSSGIQREECTSLGECRYRVDQYREPMPPKPPKRKVARIKTPRIVSDGGREACGFGERESTNRDCVVRSIAHTRCISYADAHALCAQIFEREDGKGTYGCRMMLREQGWCRDVLGGRAQSHCTLDAFVAAHPRGHYLVGVAAHSVAVCDGVVYDNWRISGLKRVQYAFEVIA